MITIITIYKVNDNILECSKYYFNDSTRIKKVTKLYDKLTKKFNIYTDKSHHNFLTQFTKLILNIIFN